MGLVIRIRHALGERMLELPERSVESPLVIGRASTADVQIPSIYVGPEHLALFIHEGQWLAQNAAKTTGSLINGKPLAGANVLAAGDVLSLGAEASPPTIEIDSLDYVAPVLSVSPVVPAATNGESRYVPPPPRPIYVKPVPALAPVETEAEADPDWMETEPLATYAVPQRQRSWDGAIALSFILTLMIVASAVIYVYMHRPSTPAVLPPLASAPAAAPATQATEEPASKPTIRTIFNEQPETEVSAEVQGMKDAPAPPPDITDEQPATVPTETVVTTRPIIPVEESEASKAFKAVESAYYNPDPAKALIAFDSYTATYPTEHQKEIEQYRADMLDKIWWERVDGLFAKRKELSAAVRKTEKDIKDETEAAYKKTVLQPRLDDQKRRLTVANDRVTKEMAYTSPNPPPIGKDAEMKDLRAKRDAKVYDAWCKRVLKHIRDTRGSYPWANEK